MDRRRRHTAVAGGYGELGLPWGRPSSSYVGPISHGNGRF